MVYAFQHVQKLGEKMKNSYSPTEKEIKKIEEYVERKTEIVENDNIATASYDTEMLNEAEKILERAKIRYRNNAGN